MEYKSFEEMPVWQKAMELAVEIFNLTETQPKKEDCGLTSQIRSSHCLFLEIYQKDLAGSIQTIN